MSFFIFDDSFIISISFLEISLIMASLGLNIKDLINSLISLISSPYFNNKYSGKLSGNTFSFKDLLARSGLISILKADEPVIARNMFFDWSDITFAVLSQFSSK